MESFLQQAKESDKTIIDSFMVHYESNAVPLKYSLSNNILNQKLISLKNEYVIHWTRSAKTCWPEETKDSYFNAMITSSHYPRGAFDTLKNMLITGRIRGSSSHIINNHRVVSFSGCSPEEFVPLMRWRSRYKCMSFEPYGIGIKKEFALRVGIRPVIYTDKTITEETDESWLYQSKGKIGNWVKEDEYRFKGDLALCDIPLSQLICFCLYEYQSNIIQELSGIRTIHFLDDESGCELSTIRERSTRKNENG